MKIKTYISGPIDANNYLIWDEISKEAVLIDCSALEQSIIDDIKANGLKLKYILLTHGHFDHVLGVNETQNATGASVVINEADVVLLENINEFGRFFAMPTQEIPKYDLTVADGDELKIGDINIKIVHTPGHTEGGICYLIGGNDLFSGDTLFKDCYGRTDLFGGDFAKIKHSLKEILFKLDDNIVVHPGHGDSSTIGYEKLYNEINR